MFAFWGKRTAAARFHRRENASTFTLCATADRSADEMAGQGALPPVDGLRRLTPLCASYRRLMSLCGKKSFCGASCGFSGRFVRLCSALLGIARLSVGAWG